MFLNHLIRGQAAGAGGARNANAVEFSPDGRIIAVSYNADPVFMGRPLG